MNQKKEPSKNQTSEEFLSKERLLNLALLFQLERFNRILIQDLFADDTDQERRKGRSAPS